MGTEGRQINKSAIRNFSRSCHQSNPLKNKYIQTMIPAEHSLFFVAFFFFCCQ